LKLVRFTVGDGPARLGVMLEGFVIDLNRGYAALLKEKGGAASGAEASALAESMEGLLAMGKRGDEAARRVVEYSKERESSLRGSVVFPSEESRLLAPLGRPSKIIGLALNYVSHVREERKDAPLPQRPFLFSKSSGTGIIGPSEDIVVPDTVQKLDYEVELGVVVGKRGRYIPKERAYEHVAGYTVFNDICDRFYLLDVKPGQPDWLGMKAQDSFSVFGPCIETDVGDPHDLRMTLKVNGEIRQDGRTSDMIFKTPDLIKTISHLVTLEPGDIIATGTCAGNAMTWGGKWLKEGDIIEAEIERIGVLKNRVRFEKPEYRC